MGHSVPDVNPGLPFHTLVSPQASIQMAATALLPYCGESPSAL
jgi:hypothetical protein